MFNPLKTKSIIGGEIMSFTNKNVKATQLQALEIAREYI